MKRKGGEFFDMYNSQKSFKMCTDAKNYCNDCYVNEKDRARLPAGAYHEVDKMPHKMLQTLSSKPPWMKYYLLKKNETKASKNWGLVLAMIFHMKKFIQKKRGDAAHKAFQPGAAGYKRVFSEFEARLQ